MPTHQQDDYCAALTALIATTMRHRNIYQAQETGLSAWHKICQETFEAMQNAYFDVIAKHLLRIAFPLMLACATTASAADYRGIWNTSYNAGGGCAAYQERVEIFQMNGRLIGRKLVGSLCVPRGAAALDCKPTAGQLACKQKIGSVSSPELSWADCGTLKTHNADTFTVCGRVYTREE